MGSSLIIIYGFGLTGYKFGKTSMHNKNMYMIALVDLMMVI